VVCDIGVVARNDHVVRRARRVDHAHDLGVLRIRDVDHLESGVVVRYV